MYVGLLLTCFPYLILHFDIYFPNVKILNSIPHCTVLQPIHPQFDTDLAKVLFGGDGGIRPAPFVFGIKDDDPAEDTEKQRYSTLLILILHWSPLIRSTFCPRKIDLIGGADLISGLLTV